MTDSADKLYAYLNRINSLENYKKNLTAQINQIEYEFTRTQTQYHKIYGNYLIDSNTQEYLNSLQLRKSIVQTHLNSVITQETNLQKDLLNASQFKTKNLTQYLAKVLTTETGERWLPIRFLLQVNSSKNQQREAYGVLQAQSLYTLPDLPKTVTLLECNDEYCLGRYGLKYKDKYGQEYTEYDEIEDLSILNNIWMFGSQNFICIGAKPNCNALFNINSINDKPFLHIPLNMTGKMALATFDSKYPRFRNYAEPNIPENHPRSIAINTLTNLINKNLEKQVISQNEQHSTQLKELTM